MSNEQQETVDKEKTAKEGTAQKPPVTEKPATEKPAVAAKPPAAAAKPPATKAPVAAKKPAPVETKPTLDPLMMRRRLIWTSVVAFIATISLMFVRFFLPRTLFEPSTVFRI